MTGKKYLNFLVNMAADDDVLPQSSACPSCGELIDMASHPENPEMRVEPGAICICFKCTAVNKYDDNMMLIGLSEEERKLVLQNEDVVRIREYLTKVGFTQKKN